jgi:uncharacterized protein YutE (UPF0331/DUF86 family)
MVLRPEPSTSSEKLVHFLGGFAAAAQLAKRAEDRNHHIEYIILAASLVDGLLRMGLILHHQIETKSSDVPDELLYQAADHKIVTERQIYQRAHAAKIIDDALKNELDDLYLWRNRVVHRYIIGDLTTADVKDVASDYRKAVSRASHAVYEVENRQLVLKVGMTRLAGREPADDLQKWAKAKHGDASLIVRPDWLDFYR